MCSAHVFAPERGPVELAPPPFAEEDRPYAAPVHGDTAMATYFHTPIWSDPLWDCGPREILPEDHDLWFIKCDHCDEIGRLERRLACECNVLWCEAHAPCRHPDDDRQPFEVQPYRWRSLRERRHWRRPPTPGPGRRPRSWKVSDLSDLAEALAPVVHTITSRSPLY